VCWGAGWHAGISKQPYLSFRSAASKVIEGGTEASDGGAGHETPAESLTQAQVALTQLGSREVQESAKSAACRIEARCHDEVYYCNIYLYYCCYIYLYYCLAARRIEALSDDEVIRMLRARASSDV
jgi:hypothetical protein